MAQGAKARGATLVALWNSPPWWMTVSGCTSGAAGGTSNLRPGMEDRFAVHICEVLQHYRDAWGVELDRVSPINEPEADWWREGGGQDGCHVDARQAALLVAALARRLQEYGLRTQIQAPEMAHSGSLGYLDELLGNGDAAAAVAELTCHQYSTDFHSLRRWPLRARQNGKHLWMSEWGNWTDHGADLAFSYARKMGEALRVMQAEAWCMWEPSFLLDQQDGRLEPNAAWSAVAQFTRLLRPGMRVVEASDARLRTTACLDEAGRRLVLVAVNDAGDEVDEVYDLRAFGGLSAVQAWRSSAEEQLVALPEQPTSQGFSATLPARSVTTFVLGYDRLVPPLLTNGCFETGKLDGWTGQPAELTGVQDNYPHGGSYDAFIDLKPGATGRLSQHVAGLVPGARYRLEAACATSGIVATLSVAGQGVDAKVTAQGGAYAHAAVELVAPVDGQVTIAYSAGPSDEQRPWATIDSVRLSPVP
jgi:O-glycosyl hydrolase